MTPENIPLSSQDDDLIIERYVTGSASAEERERAEKRISLDPDFKKDVVLLQKSWADSLEAESNWDSSKAADRLQSRIRSSQSESLQTELSQKTSHTGSQATSRSLSNKFNRGTLGLNFRRFSYSALIATACLALVFLGIRSGMDNGDGNRTAVSTYRTTNGERSSITLPDGSVVFLNVASKLEVPTDYGQGNRNVYLTGEALFTVTQNSSKPFSVITASGTTRVLGTTFIVREYATDTLSVVAVQSGKVAFGDQVVSAGEELVVNQTGRSYMADADPARFNFTRGILTLKSVSLISAIPDLNRWYNADIRLGHPSLDTLKVYGDFETGSLTDLSSILSLTFNVKVERRDKILTLYPGG